MAAIRRQSILGPQKSEPLQSALRHDRRNMSGCFAQSSQEKSRDFVAQELHIERRGGLQEVLPIAVYMAAIDRCASKARFLGQVQMRCACSRQDRETAQPSHCRLTSRCSDPGHINCLAAGVDLPTSSPLPRARVLTSQRAVAELGR
jgi:hypothetical protein